MLRHEFFSKFKFIRILYLFHCSDPQELPDSVANLEHLRSFDVSHTAIEKNMFSLPLANT